MKTLRYSITAIFFFAIVLNINAQTKIEEVYKIQLKQLEETWNILDQVTPVVWPGWKNYTDVPFLFKYANGVQMLVGHPKPPEGFVLAEGITVRDKKVYFDRSKEIKLEMILPVSGGGGPLQYGVDKDNKPIMTVMLDLAGLRKEMDPNVKANMTVNSENQILINLHELFHCYQREVYNDKYGNLRYNTDANYSIYAEIEGIALERAYFEKNAEKAKEYLKDFIVARDFKYKSMDEEEINEGACDEMREGGAFYVETMTLEALRNNYKPVITKSDDPFFFGFTQIDSLFRIKLKALRNSRENTMDSYDKSYSIGSFQALLLNRFVPGWQNDFYQKGYYFDKLLRDFLKISDTEKAAIANRLKTDYDFDGISSKHTKLTQERDDAYKMITGRKGFSFIVNFKNIFEYPRTEPARKYSMGLINLFPEGIRKIGMSDVLFTGNNSPMILDQLYHVKWVDTKSKSLKEGYNITYSRKEGEDIYYDAVITTEGFTLKAPKIKLTERNERVKITILSKVKA